MVLPVQGYGNPILPPPTKQLRVRPDGGMGPIPLDTGWTLGPVPKHIAAWALAAKRAHADDSLMDMSSSLPGRSGRSSISGVSGGSGGLVFGDAAGGGDPVLASVATGMPGARLPLVPGPDETFVSRDTGVTGERLLRG